MRKGKAVATNPRSRRSVKTGGEQRRTRASRRRPGWLWKMTQRLLRRFAGAAAAEAGKTLAIETFKLIMSKLSIRSQHRGSRGCEFNAECAHAS